MQWFTELTLVLALGVCNGAGAWCEEPVGIYGVELVIAEKGRHSWVADWRHHSDADDKDAGVEIGSLQYRFRIF